MYFQTGMKYMTFHCAEKENILGVDILCITYYIINSIQYRV